MFAYIKNLWTTDVAKITSSLSKVHDDLDNYTSRVRKELATINLRQDILNKEHSIATIVKTNLATLLGTL